MLTPFDDYPIHQTPEPIAHTVSGDRNHYDRFFFNGYASDGSIYFAAALGLYPNRSVMDAAFSIVRDGVQTSIHASRRAPLDRADLTVGPLTIRIDEPLHRLTVTIAPNPSGVTGELTFHARTLPCEEPRFTLRADNTRAVFDYTRLTQFGRWTGAVTVAGERVDVAGTVGTRDRSWGVRPVGERDQGAPGPLPQFFWLWAPVNFDDVCAHFDVQEESDGRRWHQNGLLLPASADGSAGPIEHLPEVDWDIDWRRGTRRADRARITLAAKDAKPTAIDLEPILDFQMQGIGYMHPEWGHGVWKGEDAVGVEEWKLSDIDPMAPTNLHVQQLCRATMGERTGTGILEILAIGPHVKSGFSGLLDPAG